MKAAIRHIIIIGLIWTLGVVLPGCSKREAGQKIKLTNDALRQTQESSRLATTLQIQPEERRSIVVFYFDNVTEDEDLEWMERGLMEMLITDLSQSRYVNVVGEHALTTLKERMGVPEDRSLDPALAISIARGGRLETALVGSFARVGEHIRIDAQLFDTRTGNMLKAERVECSGLEEVFTKVDELTRQIRDGLKLTLKGVVEFDQDLADVTTNSIEAYRFFAEGLELLYKVFYKEAAERFERAVEIDTTFATAYARLASAYSGLGRSDDTRRVVRKAVALADRVTERERYNIMALDASVQGDTKKIIETYERMVQVFPKDKEARYRLGSVYYALSRFDEAIAQFEEALSIDKTYKLVYNLLGYAYSSRGMHDKAVESLLRYLELAPDEPNPRDSMGEIYQMAGHLDEAIHEYKEALRLKSDFHFPWEHMGGAYMDQGEFDEALRAFRRYYEAAPSNNIKSFSHRLAGEALWAKGKHEKAVKEFREAMKVYPNNFPMVTLISDLYEEMGDSVAAKKFREEWFWNTGDRILDETNFSIVQSFVWTSLFNDLHPEEMEPFIEKAIKLAQNDFNRAECALLRGVISLKRGENNVAVAQFQEAAQTFLTIETGLGMDWYQANYISEAIAGSSGDLEDKQNFFEEMIRISRETENTALETSLIYLLFEYLKTIGDEERLRGELTATGTPHETDWWVIGPFENKGGFHRKFPPEKEIQLDRAYKGKGGKVRWRQAGDNLFDGYVNLKELLNPDKWTVAYGLLTFHSPTLRQAQLRVGTNEATKIWLNGEEVWLNNRRRGAYIDNDIIPVALLEGTNTVLIKVCQKTGEWGFYFRITDPEGRAFGDITFFPQVIS
ncbi:MAG: tetratricopeptide repeat protein [Gemmatimonadota bacterium]|nr:MAG: tetratricopeptide repeat protein [Gemmatimonadota bacterium]